MTRPTRFRHHRWLADKAAMVVHDLDSAAPACAIDDLVASGRGATFGPDSLPEALNRGYRRCPRCAPS